MILFLEANAKNTVLIFTIKISNL